MTAKELRIRLIQHRAGTFDKYYQHVRRTLCTNGYVYCGYSGLYNYLSQLKSNIFFTDIDDDGWLSIYLSKH